MSVKAARAPRALSRTIRVSDATYAQLQDIARERHIAIGEAVATVMEERADREFFATLTEEALRLRADPTEWESFQQELAEWDTTLLDGLEDENW